MRLYFNFTKVLLEKLATIRTRNQWNRKQSFINTQFLKQISYIAHFLAFLDFCYRTVVLYNFCKFLKYAQFIIFTLYLQILYPSRTCISFFCLSNIYREIPSIQGDVNLKEQGPCFQETLNEKKAAAGNTTRVILKLCLIKYELDINFYDFEN